VGIATALGTAELLRDLIVGGATSLDPAPYAAARALTAA
jgi:hypothetical protein